MERVRVEDLRPGDLVDTGRGWCRLVDSPAPNLRSSSGGARRWGFVVRYDDGRARKVSGPEGLELPTRRTSQ